MAGWDPATARSGRRAAGRATARGVAAAARAETARGARADGRRDGERRRGRCEGHHLVAQPTRADTCLREGGWTREGDGAASEDAARTLDPRVSMSSEGGNVLLLRSSSGNARERVASAAAPGRLSLSQDLSSRADLTVLGLESSWWHRRPPNVADISGLGRISRTSQLKNDRLFRLDRNRGSPMGFRTVDGLPSERRALERRLP